VAELIHIDLVFAGVDRVLRKSVQLEAGATVGDALRVSGMEGDLGASGVDWSHVGIFGRLVDATTTLRDGDRVEVYRALKIDPKEARRRRARK